MGGGAACSGTSVTITMARPRKSPATPAEAKPYQHTEADAASRPEIGAQAHFKPNKAPGKYRYDSSLAPELQWDGANGAREEGERLLRETLEELERARNSLANTPGKPPAGLTDALAAAGERLAALKAMPRPFLNWTGKAERPVISISAIPLSGGAPSSSATRDRGGFSSKIGNMQLIEQKVFLQRIASMSRMGFLPHSSFYAYKKLAA